LRLLFSSFSSFWFDWVMDEKQVAFLPDAGYAPCDKSSSG